MQRSRSRPAEEKVLNLYIWNDYLAEDTIANFEKETGIKVSVSNYGSNEELEAKLAPGNSGYDIVVPSASSYERQIKAGYYQKLDKSQLPNLKNMDPDIEARLAMHDPGNELRRAPHVGHHRHRLQRREGQGGHAECAARQLAAGVRSGRREELQEVRRRRARLRHRDVQHGARLPRQGSEQPEARGPRGRDRTRCMKFRPFLRYIDTQRMITDLANGEICVAVGYNGDILQARDRAEENKTGQEIAYVIPKEGTIIWFDSYLVPKDAPHPKNAHAFINYMLRPEVIARRHNSVNYAERQRRRPRSSSNKEVLDDPGVYPPQEVKAKLVPDLADTEETTRLMTRGWQQLHDRQIERAP